MYESFLKTPAQKQWRSAGIKRRAGVAVPLFSLHSRASIGVGDFSDSKLLIDWCVRSGMSLLQLLPLNDVGFEFKPYDAQSSFALEPMYLALDRLVHVDEQAFSAEIALLRERFPAGQARVDFRIKSAKLDLLWRMFRTFQKGSAAHPGFEAYQQAFAFWLEDYALFKAAKEQHKNANWELWPEELRNRTPQALQRFKEEHRERILFYKWLQWQLFFQCKAVKRYAEEKKILLLGDLPFLTSRDSADVWSHPHYFQLDLASGAPPDAYFAHGQRWGMPPYNWAQIRRGSYDLICERLKYAQNFYDCFRIDHAVGAFRIWTIPVSEPFEHAGLNGRFDPADEKKWEAQGKEFLSTIIQNTKMLPCAEDLGTVPECSHRVLQTLGIPGMDVQRWTKERGPSHAFKTPQRYRENSAAILSTHDTTSLRAWWLFEAGTVDEGLFQRICAEGGITFEKIKSALFDLEQSSHGRLRWRPEINTVGQFKKILGRREEQVEYLFYLYESTFGERKKFLDFLGLPEENETVCSYSVRKRALEKVSQARSIWSIQMLEDWLSLGDVFEGHDPYEFRINRPGIADAENWSAVLPLSLEKMNQLPIHKEIRRMNRKAGRV